MVQNLHRLFEQLVMVSPSFYCDLLCLGQKHFPPPCSFCPMALTVVEEKVHIEAKSRNTSYYCRKFGCDGRDRNYRAMDVNEGIF